MDTRRFRSPPRCLLGERYFIATEQGRAAAQQYKILGITSTPEIPIVKPIDEGRKVRQGALGLRGGNLVKASGRNRVALSSRTLDVVEKRNPFSREHSDARKWQATSKP